MSRIISSIQSGPAVRRLASPPRQQIQRESWENRLKEQVQDHKITTGLEQPRQEATSSQRHKKYPPAENPHANFCVAGREFRVLEIRARHAADRDHIVRYIVDLEVQDFDKQDDFAFTVLIGWDAVKLDLVNSRQEVLLGVALGIVQDYLLENRFPARLSAHSFPVRLEYHCGGKMGDPPPYM